MQSPVAATQAPAGPKIATSSLLTASNNVEVAPLTPASSVLTLGSQGTPVIELQKTLKLLGYFEGEVTGVYAATTAAAVGKFQQAVAIQRSTLAQVPVALPKPTAKKPPQGLPIWLYSLGGVVAVAAGVAILRWSGRSRSEPSYLATNNATTATIASERLTESLAPPLNGTENLKDPLRCVANEQVTVTGAVDAVTRPTLTTDRSTSLAYNGHKPAATLEGDPQEADNDHKMSPPVAVNENSSRSATTDQHPTLPSTAGQALATEAPPLSETTRMAKINIVEELVQDLRAPDATKRHKVIWELSHRGDSRAVQPLVDLLIDSDSKQRNLILSALSEIGGRTLRPMSRALAISLQDDNADVRKNAIRDLTRVYDLVAQISQLLHQATDDPDTEVQETARWALGQLNRIRSVPGTDAPALKNSVSPPESSP